MSHQRSSPAMTTNGSYHTGRNRGYSKAAWLIPAAGLAIVAGLVINTFRNQGITPPVPYEGPTKIEVVKSGDTISEYTLRCPIGGGMDQTYWDRQVMRLSGLPNSNINPGDELQVPEPCYLSEVK